MGFQNPIIPGFNPDPSIQRVGEDYFLVTSTFEWFPGVPIYHSKDLIAWELIGHALNRPSQLNMRGTAPSGGIFAPTLRYNAKTETYYLVTTLFDIINPPDVSRMPRPFFVTTKNIWDENSWSDPIYFDQQGMDPDLFFDHKTNKTHLTSTSGAGSVIPDSGYFAIWETEVDLETGDSLTDSVVFHVSTLPLDTPRLAEGSHIYDLRDKTGFIYLLTAEAGTENGHRAMIKRAPSMEGPWENNPSNPILYNGHNMSNSVLATGHADFVDTPDGDWYVVFLATRPQNPTNSTGKSPLGRETFLAPMEWNEEGWPVINGDEDITLENMPGLYNLDRPRIWRDDFVDELKDKGYYTLRTPYKKAWDLESRPGWLRLKGNVYTLSDRETPAGLFRKQVDLNTIISTEIEFYPTAKNQEAGLTLYLNLHYHNEIAITLNPQTNKTAVVSKIRAGVQANLTTTYLEELPTNYQGTVKLLIKAEPEKYTLGYATREIAENGTTGEFGEIKWVGEVESKWLQAFVQGWQLFTGTFFGVYSTGATVPLLVPADFSYLQTELL
ncbi:glycosyl hydrolase [Peziza echinospora]|nr:glycosyl hydrolase [Peziza echinospora]